MAMDREKIKRATAGRGPRMVADDLPQETGLTEVFPDLEAESPIGIAGREYEPRPYSMADLIKIEGRFGTVQVDLADAPMSKINFLAWLLIRKSEPELTEEVLSERMEHLDDINSAQSYVMAGLRLSGLIPDDSEKKGAPGRSTGN